jgi:hypothetical protein
MGLVFLDEGTRNPINQQPAQPPVDPCTALQAQLDEINEFIDENRLLQKFYAWQELKLQLRDTSAEVIDDAKIIE